MPDPSSSPLTALSEALHAWLPLASPDRAERVLRHAISALAAPENRQLQTREPLTEAADLEAWRELKQRLRECGTSNAAIGRELGLSRSAIDHVLSPAGRAPSTARCA